MLCELITMRSNNRDSRETPEVSDEDVTFFSNVVDIRSHVRSVSNRSRSQEETHMLSHEV